MFRVSSFKLRDAPIQGLGFWGLGFWLWGLGFGACFSYLGFRVLELGCLGSGFGDHRHGYVIDEEHALLPARRPEGAPLFSGFHGHLS